jgi:ankyrin repeat protein
VFDLLLSKGADINLQVGIGRTPLLLAVFEGNRHKAQWLLGEFIVQVAKQGGD